MQILDIANKQLDQQTASWQKHMVDNADEHDTTVCNMLLDATSVLCIVMYSVHLILSPLVVLNNTPSISPHAAQLQYL